MVTASIAFGLALLALDRRRAEPAVGVLHTVSDACVLLVDWITRLAPAAATALIATTLTRFGFDSVGQIGAYVAVVVVFVAQVFGIDLTVAQQAAIVVLVF